MFKPNEIERFSMALDPQMKQLEERIMADIVRRIRINGEITRAADWQINRMQQLGVSMKTVQDEIQRALGLSDEDMEKLYSDITERGYARDSKLYEATGKHRIPFEENAELQQLISSVANQTNETMRNITQSLGFAVRQPDGRVGWSPLAQYYQKTLDGAMLDIASGAFDYNTVLKRVVSEMTNSGLRTIDYATGHKNRVDVAARRALMTGMSQITAKINADNMEALDTEYVEVSWHGGARPSHQEWQGKVYRWRRGGNTGAAVPVDNSPRQQAKQVQKVQYPAWNVLTKGGKGGIIESGARYGAYNDKNDPNNKKREASAKRYYEEIRNRDRNAEIEAISKNTGFSKDDVDAIFSHVFEQEHPFEDGTTHRFVPDYYMQQSFMRIREGKNIQKHDITLLNHELAEYKLMSANPNMVYEEAHAIVEKQYNYAKELLEYLKEKSKKGG